MLKELWDQVIERLNQTMPQSGQTWLKNAHYKGEDDTSITLSFSSMFYLDSFKKKCLILIHLRRNAWTRLKTY